MPQKAKILIVDDERIKRSVLEDELKAAGFDVDTAANPILAEPLLARTVFDVIVTDLRMPGRDGLSFLRQLKEQRSDQQVIVMTAYGTVETAVQAMKLGAFDYLQKPFSTEELLLKIAKLLNYRRLSSENQALRRQLGMIAGTDRLVGESEGMKKVLARIQAVAGTDSTVLIEGESGTGKELVARLIHATSHRAQGPFIAVSCAALPHDLIESELFGHEAGAFSGAVRQRLGRFELAHGGTIFLDDADDIPMELQVKLLRTLQEHTFDRVGAEQSIRTDARVIAATKQPMTLMVAAGTFRQDLYYRLSVVPINIPPLRQRPEDIPPLIDFFLERLALKLNCAKPTVTPEAMRVLQQYSWPGNVRQLEHVLEGAIALNQGRDLDAAHLPPLPQQTSNSGPVSVSLDGLSQIDLAAIVNDVEAQLIDWALETSRGNLAQAAELLGIARSTLQYKIGKITEMRK